ncbi:MAG: HAD family hydrolase, partial [Bacteriovorax sp.]
KLSMRDPAHQKNGVFNWEKANKSFSQLSGLSLEKSRPLLELTSMRCFKGARSSLYAIPEAQEFIRFARNHYRLILATNPMWPLAVVEYRLELAEIEKENFEFITHAENMSAIKPYVEYYRELVEGLGLKASECLMIGNDPKKDGPAKALGIEVLIIKSPADFLGLKSRLEKEVRLLS